MPRVASPPALPIRSSAAERRATLRHRKWTARSRLEGGARAARPQSPARAASPGSSALPPPTFAERRPELLAEVGRADHVGCAPQAQPIFVRACRPGTARVRNRPIVRRIAFRAQGSSRAGFGASGSQRRTRWLRLLAPRRRLRPGPRRSPTSRRGPRMPHPWDSLTWFSAARTTRSATALGIGVPRSCSRHSPTAPAHAIEGREARCTPAGRPRQRAGPPARSRDRLAKNEGSGPKAASATDRA
jgi:hypothetical protein